MTADVLEAARGLKVIGRAGVGVDNIDVEAASKKSIIVMNTPGGNSMAVAELTMAMLLALPRQLVQAVASTKAGKWEKKRFAQGHELFQKTVGILGLGNIGSLVAQRCLAFGMTVLVYDPHPSEAARKLGLSVQFVSLEELVRRADFLTIHVPANEKTRNLVGASLFAQMKKGAYLVNCARGGIVDEAALAVALKDGTLAGAAMDVFSTEPVARRAPLAGPGQLPRHAAPRGLHRGGPARLRQPAGRAARGIPPARCGAKRRQRPGRQGLAPAGGPFPAAAPGGLFKAYPRLVPLGPCV